MNSAKLAAREMRQGNRGAALLEKLRVRVEQGGTAPIRASKAAPAPTAVDADDDVEFDDSRFGSVTLSWLACTCVVQRFKLRLRRLPFGIRLHSRVWCQRLGR